MVTNSLIKQMASTQRLTMSDMAVIRSSLNTKIPTRDLLKVAMLAAEMEGFDPDSMRRIGELLRRRDMPRTVRQCAISIPLPTRNGG